MLRKLLGLACFLAVLAMVFSGCSLLSFQNGTDLLQAPALGYGQDAIQNALADYLGEKPLYKFPKEGDNRSPLIMADLDGDGQKEGVLFFSAAGSTPLGENRYENVYLAVLGRVDDTWKVMAEERGPMAEIASVEAAQLLGGDGMQLVVGYANSNLQDKQMVLYSYADGELYSYALQGTYKSYFLGDFTARGGTDLAVVSLAEENSRLVLDFITGSEGKFRYGYNTGQRLELPTNYSAVLALTPSLGPEGEHLLVLDGELTAGGVASVVLQLSESGERFYIPEIFGDSTGAAMMNATIRTSRLLVSRDVNGDGAVEIPVISDVAADTKADDKNLFFTDWMDFTAAQEPEDAKSYLFSFVDADRGLMLSLPMYWRNNIEVADGENGGEWLLLRKSTGAVLLALKVANEGDQVPEGALLVPGTRSVYLEIGEDVSASERSLISLTELA